MCHCARTRVLPQISQFVQPVHDLILVIHHIVATCQIISLEQLIFYASEICIACASTLACCGGDEVGYGEVAAVNVLKEASPC